MPATPPRPLTHRTLCLVTLLLALALVLADCEVNGKPVNPSNGSTTQGLTGMMRCKDRDTGQMQREQELRDGKFVGLVRYYEQGRLKQEHSVNEKGNQQGRRREFGPEGQVLRDATYDNGDTVGLDRSFHPNGQLRRVALREAASRSDVAEAEFTPSGQLRELRCADRPVLSPTVDDATLCGFAKPSDLTYFRDDGRPSARARFERGQRVRHETLHDNGSVARSTELKDNRRTERQFSREGVKRRETQRLVVERGTVLVLDQEFAESGQLSQDRRWSDTGELQSESRYFLNGQLRSQSRYSGPPEARLLTTTGHDDTGALRSESTYRVNPRGRQQATGTHRTVNAQGKVIGEQTYNERGKLARTREWDDNGQLLRDDAVFEDGSRKAFER